MQVKLTKYIHINPQILGGTPVIAGTRIPIERLQVLVRQGYTTTKLKKEYPQVGMEKIQSIIASLMELGLDDFKKAYKTQASA